MRHIARVAPSLLAGLIVLGTATYASPQFTPPGGLAPTTPVGTTGATLQTIQGAIERNARDLETLGKASVTQAVLAEALASYLSTTQADSRYATQSALAGYLPLAGGRLDGTKGRGISLTNPEPRMGSDGVAHLDYASPMANELTLTAYAPGSNVLAVDNTAPTGFTAITFRGADANLSRQTGKDVNFEHAAVGYGSALPYQMGKGYAFTEVSRYDGTANPFLAPVAWMMQHTGAEFTSFQERYIDAANGSVTITCHGCTFPAGIDGQVIDAPTEYGLFAQPTTIKSGAGTATLTLSQPAQGGRGNVIARFGPTAYHQYDSKVWTEMANEDWYTYPSAYDGNFKTWPFFSADFNYGRIGIWTNHPEAELDVVGNAIFGADRNGRASFGNLGILNTICQPGTGNRNQVDRNTFMDGVNTLQGLCLTNPGRYRWVDMNLGNGGADGTISEQYLDGSRATRFVAHPVAALTATRQLGLTDCGTTLTVSGTNALSVTIGSGLAAGCRITVTQLGTGGVTITPLSGETLGSWTTQAQTGPYTLPGQYASVVIEAKTGTLATIEPGQ